MTNADPIETQGSDRGIARERTFRMLAGGLAALFVGFAALGGLFLWYDNATAWVSHTHAVRTGVSDVLDALREAESDERAYVLTGDRRYVGDVEAAKALAVRRLADVERMTRDNPLQQRRIAQVRAQMDLRLAVIDQVVAARAAGAPVAAIRIIRQGTGVRAMDAVRRELAAFDATERELEAQRAHRAGAIKAASLAALIGFAIMMGVMFVRTLRQLDLDRQAEAETAARLRALLADRTLLIDEVNHRVKNSLQQIASVVRLQARAAPDPATRQALATTLDRIMAVGRVHEQIYRVGENLGDFDAGLYAKTLARELIESMGRDDVVLETEVISARLDVRQATPLALILNELITNALKHGCPVGRPGRIRVSFGTEEGSYRLSVADDGPGLPADYAPDQKGSLGMRAIDALARQLRGRLVIESTKTGAHLAVVFPRS